MISRAIAALLFLVSIGGGVALAALEDPPPEPSQNDPLETINRVTFEFNRQVIWLTIRPIALGYRWIVPRPLRDGFRNGLDNLSSPILFGNQILQGDSNGAMGTLARLVVNSTLGLAGTIDVGKRLGIPKRQTDLGLTLGAWGVGEGPYLVLPFFGPSTPRDSAVFVQGTADPFNLWVQNTDYAFYAFLVRFVLGNIDFYARRIDELDSIEESSVDFYAALRDLYRQKRRSDIRRITAVEPVAPVGIDYDLDLGLDDDPEEPASEETTSP